MLGRRQLPNTSNYCQVAYWIFFFIGTIRNVLLKSSAQQLVATSSTYAEMRKDLQFLIGLFEELGFTVTLPVTVYACKVRPDNNACVILANQEIGPNKKIHHFLMKVEYCRQQVFLGNMRVEHIDTEENIADILPKISTILNYFKNIEINFLVSITSKLK